MSTPSESAESAESTGLPDASACEIADVTIHDVAFGGDGVAKLPDGMTVFVPFAAIGDHLRIRVVNRQKRYARGEIDIVLTGGEGRVEPQCPHYMHCGGCSYQHLSGEKQIELKKNQVREVLTRLGGFTDLPEIEGGEAAPEGYGYRNKISLAPVRHSEPTHTLGYVGLDGRTAVPVQTCPIAHPAINARLHESLLSGEHLRLATKNLRAPVTFRHVADKNEVMMYRIPPSNRIREQVLGQYFEAPAGSFQQVNPPVLEQLAAWVRAVAETAPPVALVDAYCGSGLFTVLLGELVGVEALGIETDRRAVKCAQQNVQRVKVPRATFFEGTVESQLAVQLKRGNKKGDTLLVLDPPRQGCETGVAEAINEHPPKRIIYVSCNPATLARDLKRFCAGRPWTISRLACFDMFPQTAHVEAVVVLDRVDVPAEADAKAAVGDA